MMTATGKMTMTMMKIKTRGTQRMRKATMGTKQWGNGNDSSRDDRDQTGTKRANSKQCGNNNDGNRNYRDDTVVGSADRKDQDQRTKVRAGQHEQEQWTTTKDN
jgi:hypothetical protein